MISIGHIIRNTMCRLAVSNLHRKITREYFYTNNTRISIFYIIIKELGIWKVSEHLVDII